MKRKFELGTSLIEVLVTIVIMAIGLLGLANVQLHNLRNVNNAQFRTVAAILAYDMEDRMRSNKAAVDAGHYDDVDGDETDLSCSPCNSTQMAQQDAYEWNDLIKASIAEGGLPPGSKGEVDVDGSFYNIKITWKEQTQSSGGSSPEDKSFTLTAQF